MIRVFNLKNRFIPAVIAAATIAHMYFSSIVPAPSVVVVCENQQHSRAGRWPPI